MSIKPLRLFERVKPQYHDYHTWFWSSGCLTEDLEMAWERFPWIS